jgi:hypothetical protein
LSHQSASLSESESVKNENQTVVRDHLYRVVRPAGVVDMEIIILLLVFICALILYREWAEAKRRNEKRIQDMEKRVTDLEAASRQRLPYKAFEEMLNAMAALDKEKTEMEFHTSLIDNAMGHMANAMRVGTVREK